MVVDLLWKESTDDDPEGNVPNVVRLELPRNVREDGASWIFIPSKNTIYIGPPGSYHIDIAHELRNVLPLEKGEKPTTGVLYDDGFVDYFNEPDKELEGRLLRALQGYHSTYYGSGDFNKAEDEAWKDNGYMTYPTDDPNDDEDDYYHAVKGLDTYDSMGNDTDPSWGSGSTPSWWKDDVSNSKGPIKMKETPGAPKPISQWSVQDYLDWRDRKYYGQGHSGFGTPREDYPHWRWSYGDSSIMPGPPHEGLWLWPTHGGYPDHFSQTGSEGLGNCAQGRVYPHEGGKWEILTWPDRPRRAPNDTIKDAIQHEAQQAVKQYLMEKIGVPEEKIYFTKMGYGSAVSWWNSPSYPGDTYTQKYVSPKVYTYTTSPLESWSQLGQHSAYDIKLKDPEGKEWNVSTMDPDREGDVRLYNYGSGPHKTMEFDPNTTPTEGWKITLRQEKKGDEDTPKATQKTPVSVTPGQQIIYYNDEDGSTSYSPDAGGYVDEDGNEYVSPGYQYTTPKTTEQVTNPVQQQIFHTNPDGSTSKIVDNYLLTYSPDGRTTYKTLTPEEKYTLRIQWFEEDQQKVDNHVQGQDKFLTNYGTRPVNTGSDYDAQRAYIEKWHPDLLQSQDDDLHPGQTRVKNNLVSFKNPEGGDTIHVSPQDYELAYRIHGDNWWKSFIPNRIVES